MIKFNIIVAVDSKNGIGKNNTIPWHIKGDMKYFQDVTTGDFNNVVIMGRKTWESIPEKHRPLKNRINIVLTRNENYEVPEGVLVFKSLEEALSGFGLLDPRIREDDRKESRDYTKNDDSSVFIIGGAQIYGEAIKSPACNKLYVTHINQDFDCDTFFPKIPHNFYLESRSEAVKDGNVEYFFAIYMKR